MFNDHKPMHIALCSGLIATVVGLITFSLSWNFYEFWDGPIPYYSILLYPGNCVLIHVWHPLFTEEISLLPKLGLILLGQFMVVTTTVAIILITLGKLKFFKRN